MQAHALVVTAVHASVASLWLLRQLKGLAIFPSMARTLRRIAAAPWIYGKGIFTVLSDRRLLAWCLVPYLIGLVTFLLFMSAALAFKADLAELLFSHPGWLQTLAGWCIFAFNVMVSGVVALVAVLALGGFFIENFVAELLRRKDLLPPEQAGLRAVIRSTLRGLRDDVVRMLVLLLLALLAVMLTWIPVLALIPPLLFFFSAGYNMIDLPLGLMQRPFHSRLALAWRCKWEVLALGAVFSLLLVIPFGAVLFMPVGYYAAVQYIAMWQKGSN